MKQPITFLMLEWYICSRILLLACLRFLLQVQVRVDFEGLCLPYYTVITRDCHTVPAVPLLPAMELPQLAAPPVPALPPVRVIVGAEEFVTRTTNPPLPPPQPPPPPQFAFGDCAPFPPFPHLASIVQEPEIHLIKRNIIPPFHPAAPPPPHTVHPQFHTPAAQLQAEGNHP